MTPKNNLIAFAILFMIAAVAPFSCKEKEKVKPDCTNSLVVNAEATASSCGLEDGLINSSVSGGTAPYEYSINGTDFQSTPEFSSLAPGNYTVSVRDQNMCTGTKEVSVNENSTIDATFETAVSGCGGSEGAITVSSSGGSGGHTYSIDGGAFQSSNSFSGLVSKIYTLTVSDENGCSKVSEVQVQSGISYGTVIKPIIDNNCAVSGCHVQGGQSPNFTVFSNVKGASAKIKAKTADKSMPKNGSLTNEQIQQIACWVDDGALNN